MRPGTVANAHGCAALFRAARLIGWQILLLTVALSSGCRSRSLMDITLPRDVSETAVHERIEASPDLKIDLSDIVVPPPAELPSRQEIDEKHGSKAGDAFSIPEAIEFAWRNSPRLLAAQAAVERTQGLEQVAFAPFLPQFDMFARYVGTSPNLSPGAPSITGGVETSIPATHTFAQTEFQLHWTICDFGRRSGRYGQAVAQDRIANLQLGRARQTVAFDVAAAYLQVLLAAALRQVNEEAIVSAEATLKDTRVRRKNGVADRDDELRGEVQLAETREAFVLTQEAEYAALARLNNVMGRNASLRLKLTDWQTEPEFGQSLVQCLERAAALRLEIGIAQGAVAYARHGREATAAEFRPKIFVLGTIGRVDGENVRTGFQEGAGIRFEQAIYHGGQKQGELRAAEAEIRQTVASAQSVLDAISLEVTLAYYGVTAARERIKLSRPAVAQARENLRLLRVKYSNGTATPTDLVDAETALTRAQQRYLSARYEYLASLAKMEYALGGQPGSELGTSRPGDGKAGPTLELPPPRRSP